MLSTSIILSYSALLAFQQNGGGWETYLDLQEPNHPSFGENIANAGDVDGDGFDDIVVGAPWSDYANVGGAGTVLVYSGATGTQLAWIEGGVQNEFMGIGVTSMGDVNQDGLADIAIAAEAPADGGNVRVFNSDDWSIRFTVKGSDYGSDKFGTSICSIPDINGDGRRELMVGDPDYQSRGAVFVFSGANGDLLRQHDAWVSMNEMKFGTCVATVGDWDGDGLEDYAIGAPNETQHFLGLGEVRVYSTATANVIRSFLAYRNVRELGTSIANAGDVNQDGHLDLIVGAPLSEVHGGKERGAAVIFSGADGSVIFNIYGEKDRLELGRSVAGVGDIDWDGIPDLLAGAPGEYLPYNNSRFGRVEAYSGASGKRLAMYRAEELGNELGCSLAMLDDYDNDGHVEFAIGARNDNRILMISPSPYLYVDHDSISASAGGVLSFHADFPTLIHRKEYKLLISTSGQGVFKIGTWIPLKYDDFVFQTWGGDYSPLRELGAQGYLDPRGNAMISLIVDPGVLTAAVGRSLHFAVVAFREGAHDPDDSSAAVEVQVLP